jgi:RNA polymerase-binding transcription factor DksA
MIKARCFARQTSPSLSSRQLAALRKKLIDECARMAAEYQRDITAAQSIQEEGVEDLEELASMDVDREQLFAYSEQDRDKLLLIEEALQRMNDGTYGVCQWSGQPIPLDRLRVLPWARYSAEVQERIERGELRLGGSVEARPPEILTWVGPAGTVAAYD